MPSDPIDGFRAALDRLPQYPPGVVPVPGLVDGTAFFAGGPGLYCDAPPSVVGLPPFPFGGVMFVGNNLDAEVPFGERLADGVPHGDRSRPMSTWRGLYRLLDGAGVDPHDCFFTNAYVGLVAGDKPEGSFPGAIDTAFVGWCRDFLRLQIERMQPAVIVTIGGDARRFVGELVPDLGAWITGPSVVPHRADFRGLSFSAVALAHPSRYPVSARRRRFDGREGVEADAALLRAVTSGQA